MYNECFGVMIFIAIILAEEKIVAMTFETTLPPITITIKLILDNE